MNEPETNFNLLKAIRETFGTQRAFAKAIGKDDAFVSEIVTGRKILRHKEKRLLAKKLQSSIGYLWPDPE